MLEKIETSEELIDLLQDKCIIYCSFNNKTNELMFILDNYNIITFKVDGGLNNINHYSEISESLK